MGKAIADPLFMLLTVCAAAQVLLYREWRRLRRTGRVGLVSFTVATVTLWLLGTHAAESHLIGRLSSVHPIPSKEVLADIDVVIVLSGGFVRAPVAGYDQPDSWTTARVVQSVRTFSQSDARLLVVSGRWALVGGSTEASALLAQAMKQLAVDLGVPPERVVVEPYARTTREHPIELLKLDIVGAEDTVGVVTSAWHLPRAMREFEKYFPSVVAVPAFDIAVHQKSGLFRWMPRSISLASSATALAEYIGMMWYRIPLRDR